MASSRNMPLESTHNVRVRAWARTDDSLVNPRCFGMKFIVLAHVTTYQAPVLLIGGLGTRLPHCRVLFTRVKSESR